MLEQENQNYRVRYLSIEISIILKEEKMKHNHQFIFLDLHCPRLDLLLKINMDKITYNKIIIGILEKTRKEEMGKIICDYLRISYFSYSLS